MPQTPTQTPNALSIAIPSTTTWMKPLMTSPPTLSTPSYRVQSNSPTKGSLTTTIRYTCPHCSVEHTLSFHLFSLTNTKTCLQSITPFLRSWCVEGSLELATLGRISMDSEEPKPEGLRKRRRSTSAKNIPSQ